jgi:hypothetical protein
VILFRALFGRGHQPLRNVHRCFLFLDATASCRIGDSSVVRDQLQKKALALLSRIANAKGIKRVNTKKPIATPLDGFLPRWTRIEKTPLCGKLPRQQDLAAAVPTARQQCAKHSSTVKCAALAWSKQDHQRGPSVRCRAGRQVMHLPNLRGTTGRAGNVMPLHRAATKMKESDGN